MSRTRARDGVFSRSEPTVHDLDVAVPDEPNPVALQQLTNLGARQRTQFALPVVIASKARIAHLPRIELPRVAH
jgi:hypothetical protein